jgi:hypothetical protein
MSRLIRGLLLATVAAVPLAVQQPAAAQDDYWTSHWNWYDNTYRPYYYRGYSYSPYYGNTYTPYGYNYGYGYSPYNYGYGYGAYGTPLRNYYGTPSFGYGQTWGGGSALNIGGMTFGWR